MNRWSSSKAGEEERTNYETDFKSFFHLVLSGKEEMTQDWAVTLFFFVCLLHCFYMLVLVNHAAGCMWMQMSLQDTGLISFRFIPRSGTTFVHPEINGQRCCGMCIYNGVLFSHKKMEVMICNNIDEGK